MTISTRKYHAKTQSDIYTNGCQNFSLSGNTDVANMTNIKMLAILQTCFVCQVQVMFVTSGYFVTHHSDMTQCLWVTGWRFGDLDVNMNEPQPVN